MFFHSRSSSRAFVGAAPFRAVVQRFSFLFFLALALGLLVIGRVQPATVNVARARAVDALVPFLDALARPMAAAQGLVTYAESYLDVRHENLRLIQANAQLKDWQNAVAALQKENRELRALLNFQAEPGLAYISARVIAEAGGPYARGLIVTAGAQDGVRVGMAAMTGDGLVGRVVEAGDWSSRVLLITDLNSRIPVVLPESGDRGILVGGSSPSPRLMYLPQDASPAAGARVLTSGHGGVFPPNRPVGFVSKVSGDVPSVTPAANMGRIDYVRLVDFGLKGGAFNAVTAKINGK